MLKALSQEDLEHISQPNLQAFLSASDRGPGHKSGPTSWYQKGPALFPRKTSPSLSSQAVQGVGNMGQGKMGVR